MITLNGLTPYLTSKWGLRGLSRVAALELGIPHAELGLQALGDAEHAAVAAHVLAQHHHARVFAQGHAQRVRDGLDHGQLRHRQPPRA